MALVIDASATVPLVLDDESDGVIAEALEAIAAGTCIAPTNWPYEMSNIIWKSLRTKRIEPNEQDLIRASFETFAVAVDTESVGQALASTLDLAIAHDLTAYDAAYLELALRRRAGLASHDGNLRAAAQREGVTVFPT